MSSEARLRRLGLLHLKDKPEELDAELEAQIREDYERINEYNRKNGLPLKPLPDYLSESAALAANESQEKSLTPKPQAIQTLSLEEFLKLPEEELKGAETIGVYDETNKKWLSHKDLD